MEWKAITVPSTGRRWCPPENGPISDFYTPLLPRLLPSARGCAVPLCLIQSILPTPLWSKSSANTTQHVFKIYGKYKIPEKIAQKNKPTWKQVVMVADWLRFPRVLTMVVGLRILTHKIDTGSPFPRGESPPRHPPSLGFIPPGRTKRQFCSDLWNDDIKSPMLLDDQAPLIGSNLFKSNVRPERKKKKKKTPILRYLKFYLSHAG